MDVMSPLRSVAGVDWHVSIVAIDDDGPGEVLAAASHHEPVPIASIGKVLLLLELARRFEDATLDPSARVARTAADAVGDSGLWQQLRTDALPLEDLAVLIASVSDNLATNVALRVVGLEAVERLTASLGLHHTRLHDRVRDVRGPGHLPCLATGTAHELATLMGGLARGVVVSPAVSATVARWLATGVDHSMVAGGLGLDPLVTDDGAGQPRLRHKTGTDTGVRADAGWIAGPVGTVAYAVVATWPGDEDRSAAVLDGMRSTGRLLLGTVLT